jgi:hypothetical protein
MMMVLAIVVRHVDIVGRLNMSDPIFEQMLTQTCTIKRRSRGSTDKWGSKTETISNVASDVPCLIQAAYEVLEFDVRGQKQTANFFAYFKIDADIEVDDIVVFNGKDYVVLGVEDAGGQGHHYECPLRSLENKDE